MNFFVCRPSLDEGNAADLKTEVHASGACPKCPTYEFFDFGSGDPALILSRTSLSVRFANLPGRPLSGRRPRRAVFKDRLEAEAPWFAALVSVSGAPASTQPLACISHHLTAEARDKTDSTSLRLLAVLNVQSSTSARANLRTPCTDGLLTHFASPRGGKCRLRTRIERGGPWAREPVLAEPLPCGHGSVLAQERYCGGTPTEEATRTAFKDTDGLVR